MGAAFCQITIALFQFDLVVMLFRLKSAHASLALAIDGGAMALDPVNNLLYFVDDQRVSQGVFRINYPPRLGKSFLMRLGR